jgi:hypothetical protein
MKINFMKKLITITILTLAICTNLFGQTDEKKVIIGIIEKMFTEMANHNPSGILELWQKEGTLAAVIKTKEGKTINRTLTPATFSQNFAVKRNELKELMYKPKVEIFNDFAMLWSRYVFFTDNKISHCGVNSFHLVKTETGWKIANASTTIEPNGCTDKEKKMKP